MRDNSAGHLTFLAKISERRAFLTIMEKRTTRAYFNRLFFMIVTRLCSSYFYISDRDRQLDHVPVVILTRFSVI